MNGMQHKFPTFKQFISEGGAATASYNTIPLQYNDLIEIRSKLSQWFNLSENEISDRFVGSGAKMLITKTGTCGDLDFLVTTDELPNFLEVMESKSISPVKKIGSHTYCFTIEVGEKKFQLDIISTTTIEWGKFSMFSDPNSQFKSGVRNELIHAIVRNLTKAGDDLTLNDPKGELIGYTRKTFNLNTGYGRIFKLANKKIEGGFTKELSTVSYDAFNNFLKEHGVNNSISSDVSKCLSPFEFVEKIVPGGKVDDFSSVETLVQLINTKFHTKKNKIFSDAKAGCIKRGFTVPPLLN